jgi:hypothetical protein
MPAFRVIKNTGYTTMSNRHLRDKSLSLKGKGLLSMLLSLPDEWRYSVNGLTAICKEGRSSVLSALQELERSGYLQLNFNFNANKARGQPPKVNLSSRFYEPILQRARFL